MADLPPPGWYDEPTSPDVERWWTGELWSEHTRRKVSSTKYANQGDHRAVGDFLGHTIGMIRFAIGAVFTLVPAGYLPYGAATGSIVYDVMPVEDRDLVGEAVPT